MGGKSRKHANQMFHKREQLGSHTDALFSAWRESRRTQHRTTRPFCWPAPHRAAGPRAGHLADRRCFVSPVFKMSF